MMVVTALSTTLFSQSGTLVVLSKSEHTASIIDIASAKTLGTVQTGTAPHKVAISPDERLAVVANYGAAAPGNSMIVIDLRTWEITERSRRGKSRMGWRIQD